MPNPITTNTAQPIQINHALAQPLFADHINAWVNAAVVGAGEDRVMAGQHMMHAYTHMATDLDLSGYNITSLPN